MVGALEGFVGEAGDVPLHFAGGGSALCVWRRGAGAFPDVHADAGGFLGLPGFVLLRDVQSLPHPAGGAADAGGRDPGRGVAETALGDPKRGFCGGGGEGTGGGAQGWAGDACGGDPRPLYLPDAQFERVHEDAAAAVHALVQPDAPAQRDLVGGALQERDRGKRDRGADDVGLHRSQSGARRDGGG
jgi:hypothetical protein